MTGTPTTKGASGGDVGSGDLALEPIDKAIKRLGVGKTTFYKLVGEKKIRLAKLPGVRRTGVASADVDALIVAALAAGAPTP